MDDRAIDRAMRRPQRYWYEDGVAEIGTGILFLVIALLFFAEAAALVPPSFSAIGLIVVVFFGVRVGRRALREIKTHVTYPRTGQVSYSERPRYRRKIAAAMLIAVTIGFVVALATKRNVPLSWIPLLDGLLIGSFLFYLGHRLSLGRFYLLAAVSAAAGALIAQADRGDIAGSGAYFGVMGATLVLSGGLTLLGYLQRPVPPPEQSGRTDDE